MLSMFSHMLGFSNSLIISKGSCDTADHYNLTRCTEMEFSYYSEKNRKLNATYDFLRYRKQKNQCKKLDFKNLLATIVIIWY